MKKFFAVLWGLSLALSLTACGGAPEPEGGTAEAASPAAASAPEAPAPGQGEAPAEQAVSAADAEEAPLSVGDGPAAVDEALFAAARGCVGRTVEELYAAVGEPTGDVQYAASCLVEDAEDGMLFYDGFYVWTVKTDTEELVHDVYLTE